MIQKSGSKMKENIRNWLHIAIGCFVNASGLIMLKHSEIVTGGTAGLSLSLSSLLHVQFHYIFALINLPFFIFSYFYMGRSFTAKTILSIAFLSLFSGADGALPAFSIPPLIGAIAGGAFIGAGLITLFRNDASLGGATILAVYLHKRYGINPGKTNFSFDLMVVLTSLSVFSLTSGLFSALSIAVTSGMLSFYKRRKTNDEKTKDDSLPSVTTLR
ncbi:YitT family protein [Paenibacillus sp. LHD-38]|uniref:YitT family protein n=1 Tax=Paenibacillus sp. LHD-38 TaxID=3072143 RepID=UPI00280DDE0D|nr:YitT family protein [Paenibacillus sp. LHD-38]MDQ8736230.1 YitT family protein [Paenibacillus sp. LHD-38]